MGAYTFNHVEKAFAISLLIFCLFAEGLEYDEGRPRPLFPPTLRGEWYSWDYGRSQRFTISRDEVLQWGFPTLHSSLRSDVNDYVFRRASGCLVCSRFISRSWNVVERIDSQCINVNMTLDDGDTIRKVGCIHLFNLKSRESEGFDWKFVKKLPPRGKMMFREDPAPVNCRHSIYGSYRFSYQMTDSFTGECQNRRSRLHSCDSPGSQFLISNQKFLLQFHQCEGMKKTYDGSGEFVCLGEWREGLRHYFIAANIRESRKEERYRCFIKDLEQPYYVGMSRSPSCKFLRTPENSPVRIRLEPIRDIVQASCFLPNNLTGSWISSGPGEPFVQINATHIVESRWAGHQLRKDINVCIQNKGTRFLMAKVSEFGCQTEFVCWELLPRHHNIIRFRKGRALTLNTFEVCDFGHFEGAARWKYDTLINDEPDPIECPFSGRFTFGQMGPVPLQRRILNGITRSPLDTYHCPDKQTDLSICDIDRKQIIIDLDRCFSLNVDGNPMEVKNLDDYHFNCVGYWKENLISYLVTHDPFDSVSRFRCWVYQRVSLTEIRLSQGLGSACGLHQTFSSASHEEGASLALNLSLRERLHDHCPMYYDDGSNPWKGQNSILKIFHFTSSSQPLSTKFSMSLVVVGISSIFHSF